MHFVYSTKRLHYCFYKVNNKLTRKLKMSYFIGDGMGQKGSGFSDNGGDVCYYFSS